MLVVWKWVVIPMSTDRCCTLVEKELVEERKKLYEAIGYSENAKLATYSVEVCACIQLICILDTQHSLIFILCIQYVAHCLNFDLQQVSLTLCNEEGRLVN